MWLQLATPTKQPGLRQHTRDDGASEIQREVPSSKPRTWHPGVVEHHDAPGAHELHAEEGVEKGVVEPVGAIDEGEVELASAITKQFW
ncbi:MAG: hypothetical protein JWL79_1796 [Frankiales bacterium]|nr:hypothetical protein [Frankiales bacterium]